MSFPQGVRQGVGKEKKNRIRGLLKILGLTFEPRQENFLSNDFVIIIKKCFGSALVSMRIRIRIQGFDSQKLDKNCPKIYILYEKLQFS
jgi:hypothetical protein